MRTILRATFLIALFVESGFASTNVFHGEQLPLHLKQKKEEFYKFSRTPQSKFIAVFNVLVKDLVWLPGQKLNICFFGGDPQVNKTIAAIASQWTQFGNLSFDFGLDNVTNDCRQCQLTNKAEIRISFEYADYWSLVGTESVDLAAQSDSSMNFQGFQFRPYDAFFTNTVLHEFGHALGFHHEHQNTNSVCEQEFNWPQIVAYLKALPIPWDEDKINKNLRRLPSSSAYIFSQYDPLSVMHYSFPDWMYLKGTNSPCFVPYNTVLSRQDKLAMAKAYPARAKETVDARIRQILDFLDDRNLPTAFKLPLMQKLDRLEAGIFK